MASARSIEELLLEFRRFALVDKPLELGRLANAIIDQAPRGKVKVFTEQLAKLASSGEDKVSERTLYRWMERAKDAKTRTADATHE